jgi:hypothetical protein
MTYRGWQQLGFVFTWVTLLYAVFVVSIVEAQGPLFGPPTVLNTTAATDMGGDGGAHVATDSAGHWVAVWSSFDSLGGTTGEEGDILVARSEDNGMTWTAPQPLNTTAATDEAFDFQPAVVTDGAGHWVAVWSSCGTLGPDCDILAARSTDNGATWTSPKAINTDAATDTGDDQRPQIATDGAGHWVAVWEFSDFFGDVTDILVARSADNGETWTPPQVLNVDEDATLGDGEPSVATDRGGHWVAVWTHEFVDFNSSESLETIYVARSTDNGATWTAPQVLSPRAGARNATVKTNNGGLWVAAWNAFCDDDGGVTNIGIASSTDDGATWTRLPNPDPNFCDEGKPDFEHSFNDPQLAADGAGHWVLTFSGSQFDQDGDIFVSLGTEAQPVAIDIKPCCTTNRVQPQSSVSIPVAVLSVNSFDATTIDASTVRFGATGTEAAPRRVTRNDANGDGRPDLVLRFRVNETGIQCGDTMASLTGQTVGGQLV